MATLFTQAGLKLLQGGGLEGFCQKVISAPDSSGDIVLVYDRGCCVKGSIRTCELRPRDRWGIKTRGLRLQQLMLAGVLKHKAGM